MQSTASILTGECQEMEEVQMVLQAQFGGGLAELATNAINYGLSVMGKARVLTVLVSVGKTSVELS